MFAPPPYASPTSARSRDRGHSSSSSTSSNSYMSTPTPSSAMSYSSSSSLSLPVSPDGTDALTASMSSSSIASTSTASSTCSACCHSERGICPQHKLIQLSLKGIDSSGTRPRNLSQPLPMTGSSRTLAAAGTGTGTGTGAGSKERRSSLTNRDMEFISATRTCTPRAPFIKPLNINLQRATSVPATATATATSKSASNLSSNMQHSNPNPSSTSMKMSPISASSLLSTRSLQRSLTDNPNPSNTLPSSTYSPSTFLSPLPTLSQYAIFQPPSSSSSTSSSSGSSPIPAPRHNLWGLSLSLSPNPPPRFSTISDSYAPTTASTAFPTFSPLIPNNHSRDFNNKRVADCLEESAPSSPWIAHDQNAKKRHVYVSPGFNPRHMQAQMMTSNTAATGSATSSAYASLATSPYSIHVSPFGHTPLTSSGYASGASSPSTTYATPIPISPFLPTYPLSSTNRHARRRSSNPFEFPPGSLGSGSGPNSANSSPSTSRRNSLLPPPPMYGSASGPGSGHALEVNATLTMPSTMPIANMSYDTNMAEQPTFTFTPSPLPLNVLATTATSTPASSSASNSASVTPSITPVPAATSAPSSSFSSSTGYYPPVSASVSDPAPTPTTGSASTSSSSAESSAASPNADADEEAIADADLTEELAELHQQLSLQAEQARRQLQDVEFRMQVTAASIDTIHAMMMAKQRTPNTPATPITPNNTAATTPTNIYMHGSGPTTPSHSMTPMQLPLQMPPHMQQMPAMGLMRSQSVPYPSHSHGYAPAHGHGQGQGHGYNHGPYTMSMTPAPYSPMDQHMTTTSTLNPQHTYQ